MAARAGPAVALLAVAAMLAATTGSAKPGGRGKDATASTGDASAAPSVDPAAKALPGDTDDDKKEPQIDLTKGPFIQQLEAGHMPRMAFEPAPEDIKPYAGASLGADVAFTLVHDGEPLAIAPKLESECQTIVDTLLSHWKGPAPKVRVRISANKAYGARANSAGLIVVFLGTFVSDTGEYKVANRDELALLLGHELGHILLLHPRTGGAMDLLTKAFQTGTGLYSNYAIYKDANYSNNQINVKPDNDMLIRSVGADAMSSSLMLDLLLPGRTRHREMEADQLGLDLAWRSGYRVGASEVSNFVHHNAEDDASVSERMETMRGVMITILAHTLARQASSGGGMLGPFKGLFSLVAAKGANIAATRLFDSLAKAREEHLNPDIRANLLGKYYDANVKDRPDFDVKTEPRPHNVPKTVKNWHPKIGEAAIREAASLSAAMAWSNRYEDLTLEALGTAMEDDEDREKREEKHAGLVGKMREAMAKTAEANKEDGDKSAEPEASQKDQDLLKHAQDLAASMTRAGSVNPLVASSSHGAGRLASMLLRQEPRGQAYWFDGERQGYPIAKLYRAYGSSLNHNKNGSRLPALTEDYRSRTGTIEPVIDVAVGAEVAKGDIVAAETLAAHCLELSPNGLYPSCAAFLGYNPAAKGGKAKTPEGRKAFSDAKMSAGIKGFLDFGHEDR